MAQDRSRSAFNVSKHWSSLQAQQGRLLSDDDWNEADAIDKEDLRRTRVELIGASGSPDSGFQVTNPRAAANRIDFDLLPGSIYVGGLRVALENTESFTVQKDWLQQSSADRADLTGAERIDQVYLEVWQQPVTAVEDEELLEVALGGPDTSVRLRTMRRVRVEPNVGSESCANGWNLVTGKLGQLSADNELVSDATLKVGYVPNKGPGSDLCSPSAQDGYLGAENQAIRVEIGSGGSTIFWGYDNASPFYRVQVTNDAAGAQVIHFLQPPKDEAHWPLAQQTIELLPWSAVLPNGQKIAETSGGFPAKVTASYDPDTRNIKLDTPVPPSFGTAWQGRADASQLGKATESYFYLRVWNRASDTASPAAIPFTAKKPVELEGTGLTVTLSGTTFRQGDFWIIAARPESPAKVVPWQLETGCPPEGIRRFYAPLGLIHWRTDGTATVFDCRETYAPLTRQRGCCITLSPATNWQHTLESVATDPDVCICFQPGDFVTTRTLEFRNKNVCIHGDGGASRVHGRGIETVFQFTGCLTAKVSDLSVDADTLLPKQSNKPHLSGAITAIGCGKVDISRITARCTSGPATSSSAIAVYSEPTADRALASSARIQGCDIIVGANQVGLSVINYGRATIADNTVQVDPRENQFLPPSWLQNKAYLRRFRRALIYRYGLADGPGATPVPAGAAVVTIGERKVWIETDPKLSRSWVSVVSWRKFPTRRSDYLAVGDFLYELAADLIRGGGKIGRHGSQPFSLFLTSRVLGISSSATGVRTIGARGIVVGGTVATDARITGNTVRDVIQGIHVGISAKRQRKPGPGQGVSDTAGRVIIAGNTTHIVLMPESAFERHGIFVGNCQSLLIQDNYATCDRVSTADRLAIDGIRVYGFLGPFAYITRNHLSGFTTGIRVAGLNNTSDGPSSMWRVVDNIAVGAAKPVDLSLKKGTTSSITPTGNKP
jgi:Family of unknown function (DUF6519)